MSSGEETENIKPTKPSVYKEYMKQLRQWSHDRDCYYWMWNHYYSMQTYMYHMQMINSTAPQVPAPATSTSQQPLQQSNQTPNIQNSTSLRAHRIPTMLRRAVAELLDFLILLVIKTVGLYIIVYIFDLKLSITLQSDGLFNSSLIKLLLEEEVSTEEWTELNNMAKEQLASMEGDFSLLILVTLLYRIFTGLYEWLFIWAYGCTPGKYLANIKVVSCVTTTRDQSGMVVVNPGTSVPMSRALVRCFIKNFMISLMIPAFLSAFFSSCRRTNYDEMSRTIVVYHTPPVPRR